MKAVIQIVIVAVLAGLAYVGWQYQDRLLPLLGLQEEAPQKADRKRGRPPMAVEVAPVHTGKVEIRVDTVGSARANEAVNVTVKVAGRIESLHFEEGQHVEKGAVLARLDARQVEAGLAEKQADLENSRKLLARAKELLKKRNVPEARVEELEAQVLMDEAKVRAVRAELADYVIAAPFAGVLGLRQVSLGALLRPGDVITSLDDVSKIKLDFEVPETRLANLATGLTFQAVAAGMAERPFEGRVATIDSRIDPVTRTVKVRGLLDNVDGLLKPGMFLTVSLVLGVRENALLVPEEAILASGSGTFLFVLKDGKAARREVRLGQRLPGEVEVLSGLEIGEQVITAGGQKLRDGAAVRPVPPGKPSSETPAKETPAGAKPAPAAASEG